MSASSQGVSLSNSDNMSTYSESLSGEKAVDMADFISEFLYNPYKAIGSNSNAPVTTEALVEVWKNNDLFKAQFKEEVSEVLKLDSKFALAQFGEKYVHSALTHVKLLVDRQFILMSRNKVFLSMRIFSAIFMVCLKN